MMSQPTPNSPEFSKLPIDRKWAILRKLNGDDDLIITWYISDPKPEPASEIWTTAAAEAEALKRWQGDEKTPAYTSVERALKNIAIRREQEDQ